MISSKEIIKKAGISRATLNNYIKLGIIPRPIIKLQNESDGKAIKLGYFSESVLERIKKVKILKQKGYSMDEISGIMIERDSEIMVEGDYDIQEEQHENIRLSEILRKLPSQNEITNFERRAEDKIYKEELKLNFKEIRYPAYLVNFDLNVTWINRMAEMRIFQQEVRTIGEDSKNIFKLIFNWGFNCDIKNWKDLLAYHMSFAKIKFTKTWIPRLYNGISNREINILEKFYDEALAKPDLFITDAAIKFINNNGSIDPFHIYSLSFKEGILYIYIPHNHF